MAENVKYNSLVILGPTASGKTNLAVTLAEKLDGEIISADSRQVYRGLNIGSGKDIREYSIKKEDGSIKNIQYHLIDVADPKDEYNLYRWKTEAENAFLKIEENKRLPIFCGGTGMYVDSILRHYELPDVPTNFAMRKQTENFSLEELQSYFLLMNPQLHNDTDLTERHRLLRAIEIFLWSKEHNNSYPDNTVDKTENIKSFVIGVFIERDELIKRIYKRLIDRVEEGLIEEVNDLHEKENVSWEKLERFGLEYRFVAEYLQGKNPSKEKMIDLLFIAIRQFAKRQMTWFRGMERKGVKINWVNGGKKETFNDCFSLIKEAGFSSK